MFSSSTVTLHMYVASHVEMGSNGDERRAGHGKLIPSWSLGKPAALDLTVTSSELKFVWLLITNTRHSVLQQGKYRSNPAHCSWGHLLHKLQA